MAPKKEKELVLSALPSEVVIIPILNSPIYPGMIAPIILSEDKYSTDLDDYLAKNSFVALNLVKFKESTREQKGSKAAETGHMVEVINDHSDLEAAKTAADELSKNYASNNSAHTGGTKMQEMGDDEQSDSLPIAGKDLYKVGVFCKVVKRIRLPDGSVNLLVHGLKRFRIIDFVSESPILIGKAELFEDVLNPDEELDAYTRSVINQVKKLSEINPYFNEEMKLAMLNSPSSGALADLVAFALSLDVPEAQDFLETLVVKKRFAKLLVYLKREKDVAEIQKKINDEVNDKVNKYQKEYFLREQLKVIRQELGMEEDDKTKDVKKIKESIDKIKLPDDVKKVAYEELNRLETIPESSPEYHVARTYLHWIIDLPWDKSTQKEVDIDKAEKILNRDHYGLEKPKRRILEFLAVRKLKEDYDGTILCFAGPPGVGKTSLGQSIANSLGRKFYRFSLGGMRDEAEIKGHRKTYVGAMPGKLIQALKRVAVNNPVIMLDEIDKMGHSFQGDPASALLEVLDPEQNKTFIDNYLDIPFDLSKVLFIATANYLAEVPEPLLDRMEVIELSGYTLEEKLSIATRWIIPKQLKKHGLKDSEFKMPSAAVSKLIADYAREPGVRVLDQMIAKLCRTAVLQKVKKKTVGRFGFTVLAENLEDSLGPKRFHSDKSEKTEKPGIVTGLAWTAYGGDILQVECLPLDGKGLKITGQLGDVMNESVNIAFSYVRSLLQIEMKSLAKPTTKEKSKSAKVSKVEIKKDVKVETSQPPRVQEDYLAAHEIHLHIPAGATPKDGPSAGITMALAFHSLANQKKIRSSLAMTGELSLVGKVLPVGGIKEKVLAAKRAGIKEIILPFENQKDLKEVPERHRKGIKFYSVKHFADVLKIAYKRGE